MRPYERALNMVNTMEHETRYPKNEYEEELHDAIATPEFDLKVGDYIYEVVNDGRWGQQKIVYEIISIYDKFFRCKRLHTGTPTSFTKVDYFLGDVKKYD